MTRPQLAVAVAAVAAWTVFASEAHAQYAPPAPYGAPPPYGAPAGPYGAPPPAYGAPPPAYGAPPPAYGAPPPAYGAPPPYGGPPPAYGGPPPAYGGGPGYGGQGYGNANANAADRAGFSVAALLGFGFVGSGYGGAFDFGARAGYTLPAHLYLGAELGYAVGSVGVFNLQGEVGYDIGIPQAPGLMIRPYVGLGFADAFLGGGASSNVCQFISCPSTSAQFFLLSPGGVVAYHITPNFFVGGDVRIPIYIGSGSTAGFDLLGTGGYKF